MQWHRELTWNPTRSPVADRAAVHGRFVPVRARIVPAVLATGRRPHRRRHVRPRVDLLHVGRATASSSRSSTIRPILLEAGSDLWAWQPHKLLWWAAFVQFIGTLFFNANTISALVDTISTPEEADRLVWAPDFLGCIAFLVASHLFWLAVCHRLWAVQRTIRTGGAPC